MDGWKELESEVFEVMKDLNCYKAPGLDGFSLAFFLTSWKVLPLPHLCWWG